MNEETIKYNHKPPMYDNPEEMSAKIDEYFKTGVKTRTVRIGKGKDAYDVDVQVPTITGLCLYLGFESRQSFYDYEKKEGFAYTIKRARLMIENVNEENLQIGNTTGAIFALKNMGWKDSSQVENTVSMSNFNVKDLVSFDEPEDTEDQ